MPGGAPVTSPAASTDVCDLTAQELLAAYRARALSPVEVVDALLARIDALDPALGAFTALCAERARREASAHERAYMSGRPAGPLAGAPIGVKDLFDTEGVRTAYGSPMFASNTPTADAATVRRVREAGAVLVGKTQTHEFAWGITSVNARMGTVRNPWRTERVAGGSSGGSAVALAARLVPLAMGSDTGGSIRIPSAFCGTVGFKPTYGRIATDGVWPLAPSLDHVGPMARTPADAALLLGAMERGAQAPAEPALEGGLAGARVGVCPDLHLVPLAPNVQCAFDGAVRTVRELGARVDEVALPAAHGLLATFGVIQLAEALWTHSRAGLYPDRRTDYGEDVRRRLDAAERVMLADYLAATAHRERLRAAVAALFEQVDLLISPTAAGSPLPTGDERVVHLGREIEFRELVMTYTVLQDLLGLPACCVRAGFDDLGIPIGVQLTGAPRADRRVLAAAQALYAATPEVQGRWPDSGRAAPKANDGLEPRDLRLWEAAPMEPPLGDEGRRTRIPGTNRAVYGEPPRIPERMT
jgi:aspartyl-tRNA(Asn)/glutamyl-tRNA(Gln) amidotransferase subunit A